MACVILLGLCVNIIFSIKICQVFISAGTNSEEVR